MKEILFRKKPKSIHINEFGAGLVASDLSLLQHESVDVLVDTCNTMMSKLIDKHAPLKKCVVTVHTDPSWINIIKSDRCESER